MVAAVGIALAIAGCSTEEPAPPQVTFQADGQAVLVRPFLYCDARVTSCRRDEPAIGRLKAAVDTQVQVTVPVEIADTPWSVLVQYQGQEPRSVATFAPGRAREYTVVPEAGSTLAVVEIQQAGAANTTDATGENSLVARAVWSLQLEVA
jgi:hypothetical protein